MNTKGERLVLGHSIFQLPPPHPQEDGGFLKKEFFISSSIKLKIIRPFRHFFSKVLTNTTPQIAFSKGANKKIEGQGLHLPFGGGNGLRKNETSL